MLWGLFLAAILVAAIGGLAGAAGKGKKKPKVVTVSGKLQDESGTYVDQASSISMKVVIRQGEPQKIKKVSVTFSYTCADDRTGVASYNFPEPIDVDFEPGVAPDRVDYQWEPPEGGLTGLFGDVTKKGRSAFGQVFVGLEDSFCGNYLSSFSARK